MMTVKGAQMSGKPLSEFYGASWSLPTARAWIQGEHQQAILVHDSDDREALEALKAEHPRCLPRWAMVEHASIPKGYFVARNGKNRKPGVMLAIGDVLLSESKARLNELIGSNVVR